MDVRNMIQNVLDEKDHARELWLAEKAELVAGLTRRAKASKTLANLDEVADLARSRGVWDAGSPPLRVVIGECNSKLRGYDGPVIYKKGGKSVLVQDNQAQDGRTWRTHQLCAAGYHYLRRA